jgi:hypothetical protein
MIISWFTKPEKSFDSYYQYDTVTKNFVRIRLELGRNDGDDSVIIFEPKNYVGFSRSDYPTKGADLNRWSVNAAEELCYNGVALRGGRPSDKDYVYDTDNPTEWMHPGNPVTYRPYLPHDIQAKHLALIANDAFERGQRGDDVLTRSNVDKEVLDRVLQERVCRILDVPVADLRTIPSDVILNKLINQTQAISGRATRPAATNFENALGDAGRATGLVIEQLTNGTLTPNEQLESAFGGLGSAIYTAQQAKFTAGMGQSLLEMDNARQAVADVIRTLSGVQGDAIAREFSNAEAAFTEVRQQVTEFREVQLSYQDLVRAATVEDYTKELIPEYELVA